MKRLLIISVGLLLLTAVSGLTIPVSPASQELAKRNIPFSEDRFIYSILHKDTTAVSLFLRAGMNPNLQNQNTGMTALMLAIKSGNKTIVRALLAQGAKVNGQENEFGYTPLMLAVLSGDAELVQLLLDKKADMQLKSTKGETAVMLAADNEYDHLVKMLVKAGAAKYGTNRNKNLITAIVLHDTNKVKQLLTAGANPDTADAKKNTTLYIATFFEFPDIIKLLLEHGAKENINRAFNIAAMKSNLEIVTLIKQARHLDTIDPILDNNRIIGLAYDEDTDKVYDKKEYFDSTGIGRTEWFKKGQETPITISWPVYDKKDIKRGQKISLTGTMVVDAVNEKSTSGRLELAKEVTDPDWIRITNYTPVFEKNVAQYYPALIKKIVTRENSPEKEYLDPRLNYIYYFENGMKRNLEYFSRPGGPSFMFETQDRNKDGNPEYVIISEYGDWKMSYFDLNDNGIPEKWEYPGLMEFDTNEDGQIDRWMMIDKKTDKVLLDTKDKKVYETYTQQTTK